MDDERRYREPDDCENTEHNAQDGGSTGDPRAHDQRDTAEARNEAENADTSQPLAEEKKVRQGNDERQAGGDDRSERGFHEPHGQENKAQIERILTDAENDDGLPLFACELEALTEKFRECQRNYAGDQEPHGQCP